VDFNFSEQQSMLRAMAREFITSECPKSRVKELEISQKGYDPELWNRMAGLGWQGLTLPEEYGGSNADFMDLVVLMEEMGRNILPGPFFSTIALAAFPLLEFGSESQKARYLPPIVNGEKIWTLAVDEVNTEQNYSHIKTTAQQKNDGYVLNGEKIFVPYADIADYILVAARTKIGTTLDKGLTLFIIDTGLPGITVETIATMTGEKQCQVIFSGVHLSGDAVVGVRGDAARLIATTLDRAGLLKCAEVSGACQAVLDMTGNYARERSQFGKTIGAFQVIQHKLVDMLIEVEGLQYLVYQAAWLMSIGLPCTGKLAAAKAKANNVYQSVALDGVKIHGAIGFSMDHDIGLYYRRVMAAKFFPYNTDHYLEEVAVDIGL
jgi:alkylation response protein AidB-like acyl-CoA dehydrogenase